ncbi:MAG TPA: PIG-L family deacetylase, partial [Polyangiaceae bacterium]|nr:PIG-L family deacetylase [Polyangiaceae bacterium]
MDPFVEVCHGEVTYRQYFERGAAGRRHLNLSPLFTERRQSAVGRVGLCGGSIRLERDATLVLFDPPPIGDAPIVVLAPHPDDAEIAAFGIYHGQRSWVATITAGEMGGVDLSRIISSGESTIRWNAFLRVWDSVTIPQLGEVPAEQCLNLVYPDTQLRTMHEHVNRPARIACDEILSRRTLRLQNRAPEFQGADSECTWMDLVDDLRRLLDKAKPGIVVCPHPLIDEHPD